MSFTWNPTPNIPSRPQPQPYPSNTVAYKINAVANTVDYGGTVRYNTANRSYDIVYEFPTLNVADGVFENGFISTANVGQATLNSVMIDHAILDTANITNATITFGYVTGDPTSNMFIASKQYVDNAIANISTGTGPDSTANLFISTGDLLVGIAPNTAQREGVGEDGSVLSVYGSSPSKVRWSIFSDTQRGVNISIGTHHHPALKNTQVLMTHADGFVMQDGEYVPEWNNLVADITVSGAGGLDAASSEAPNAWYEVYAIRNSTTGDRALLLHRTLVRTLDQFWPATAGGSQFALLRAFNDNLTAPDQRQCTKISQSFVPSIGGPLKFVDLRLSKNPTPNGNIWVTIQNEDGTGNASGTILGTSLYNDLTSIESSGTAVTMRFIFDTKPTLTMNERYHIVVEGDWPVAVHPTLGNSVAMQGNTAPLGPGQQMWMANVGYTRGNLFARGYGDARIYNVVTSTWKLLSNTGGFGGPQDLWFKTYMEQLETALALPAGYDQYVLVSYVCNGSTSNFKEYHQQNRTLLMGFDSDWSAYDSIVSGSSSSLVPIDLSTSVPPVACGVQFYANTSGVSGSTFPVSMSVYYGASLSAFQDYHARGTYNWGPANFAGGIIPVIQLLDLQTVNIFESIAGFGIRLTVLSIVI